MSEPEALRDGVRIPWALLVLSITVIAGGGGMMVRISNMQATIDKQQEKLDQKEDTTVKERIAALESNVSNLKNDMGQNASSHQAMWQAIGKKADR